MLNILYFNNFLLILLANTACDILSGENILNELIDGDFGKDSPNPVTPYQLQKCGFSSYQALVSQIGFAYHWAQRVCGMDFLIKQVSTIFLIQYSFCG